jgi:hypothetical protein
MSGLPFNWSTIQRLISELQTPNLVSIYAAIQVAVNTPAGILWPSMNSTIQILIDQANAEIASIQLNNPSKTAALNTLWNNTGTQLTIEQRTRLTGLSELPSPRSNTISNFPATQYSFIDAVPRYALNTEPHMYAQTLEAISDLSGVGGQSIVGLMRETRNTARLSTIGIALDNNISDVLPRTSRATLIANGSLQGSIPATIQQTNSAGMTVTPNQYGNYDPATNTYYITNPAFGGTGQPVDTGQVVEPGSLAGSPYQGLIAPELNVMYASGVLLPSTPTVQDAITDVVRCNCDCWAIV